MKNINYTTIINGNKVEILKRYRTRTQFEYILTIFIGNSEYESILNYMPLHLTKKSAIREANEVILNAKKPRIEKVIF